MIPLFTLNRSSTRVDEIAARIRSDYADISIAGTFSAVIDLESIPDVASAIVLTSSEDLDGESVVARVRRIRSLGARVIVIGDKDFPKGVVPAMAAGADAVIPREASSRRVVDQVRLVATRAQLIDGTKPR